MEECDWPRALSRSLTCCCSSAPTAILPLPVVASSSVVVKLPAACRAYLSSTSPQPLLEFLAHHHVWLPDLYPASSPTVPPGCHAADALRSTRGKPAGGQSTPGAGAAGGGGKVLPWCAGRGADGAVAAGGERQDHFSLLEKKLNKKYKNTAAQ